MTLKLSKRAGGKKKLEHFCFAKMRVFGIQTFLHKKV